jgi:hypothetical protein
MRKFAAGALCLALLVTPALAAQYVVVQNSSTHKCAVTTKTPAGPGSSATAFPSTYDTRADAEAAMGRMRACGIAE